MSYSLEFAATCQAQRGLRFLGVKGGGGEGQGSGSLPP